MYFIFINIILFYYLSTLDLEWKVVYLRSPNTTDNDQELVSIAVGPIAVGTSEFDLDCDPINIEKIPIEDVIGMTGILLSCFYHD
jgi:histone chaperone ASF1